MKNYIENIDLINAYLDKTLSKTERLSFENRLKNDTEFKQLYNEQLTILEGVNRVGVKEEIKKAYKLYKTIKLFKSVSIITSVLLLFIITFINVFKTNTDELKSMLNFESEFIQEYKVASDSIITIVGNKGTTITFKTKDLVDESNNNIITDSLIVNLIELTNKQDLLLANAQTISNNKWLISGGAFKIEIKAQEKELFLKKEKTIKVKFPKSTKINNDGMELFYGNRDENNYMNWTSANKKLNINNKYVITYEHIDVVDVEKTEAYGGIKYMKEELKIDSIGFLTTEKIKIAFPEISKLFYENDTLRVYMDSSFRNDFLTNNKEESTINYLVIFKKDLDSIKNGNTIIEATYYNEIESFYETIELSKLGWINVDRYTNNEELITVTLTANKKTSSRAIFIIDERNNTFLNVYDNSINLPINRSFYIMSIGIEGEEIYGFKRSILFKKNSNYQIEYKKIKKSQIKSILTL